MGDIVAVLLVPAEGDPHGLLAEGPCGARPPMVTLMHCARCGRGWWEPRPAIFDPTCRRCGGRAGHEVTSLGQRALVLAWDGEPLVDGLDRLRRMLAEASIGGQWPVLPDDAAGWACGAEGAGIGTRILLDAEGREVTP